MAVIFVREDQKANQRNRGSADGLPPAFGPSRCKETQHRRTLAPLAPEGFRKHLCRGSPVRQEVAHPGPEQEQE
jgi:hypothetical protein